MSVLLEREIGKKALLMGNEALVRGAYEAGLDYASCYPGTPSSEVSNLLYELQGAGGFRMDFATNEKVAMEARTGGHTADYPARSGWRTCSGRRRCTPRGSHGRRDTSACRADRRRR